MTRELPEELSMRNFVVLLITHYGNVLCHLHDILHSFAWH